MELVGVGVLGWLVYLEWKAGRITVPLAGYGHLVDAMATFTAAQEIVSASIITETDRARGAISNYELQSYVASQLAEQRFPRSRMHDLRQAICAELRRRDQPRNASDLKIAFNSVAEIQDYRAKEWAR